MRRVLYVACLALGLSVLPAHAQPMDSASRALSECVVRSTSAQDSVVTARWLFIAMSRHPDLPQSSRVSDADGLEANRQMGGVVNRLLFDACANEARAATSANGYEGAINVAFGTLGEAAMAHLMNDPDVLASVIQLGAYVDRERLTTLSGAQ